MNEFLTHSNIIKFLMAVGIILILSRIFSEITRKLKLPSVLGEIFTGIFLGPTILGNIFPDFFESLFPFINNPVEYKSLSISIQTMVNISVIMLLFVAGMELNLRLVINNARKSLLITFFSMTIPILTGFVIIYFFPNIFGVEKENVFIYSFFIGLVMSVTALPIVARILMDMNIFKTNIGTLSISSAMFIDMLGWILFSVLISLMGEGDISIKSILYKLLFVFAYGIGLLTLGVFLINKTLPWVQDKFAWPGGVLALSIGGCFISAGVVEIFGIHSVLGAFLLGIALGNSSNLRKKASEIIHQFVSNVFAPFFFVSIGLYVDFISGFNWKIVLIICSFGFVSKILSVRIGARLSGLRKKECISVSSIMNIHGALEIILANIALTMGLINKEVFVAIVIFVIASILVSIPMIKKNLK